MDNPNAPIDEPRCVDACITGALTFAEESEVQDIIANAEVLLPKSGDDVQAKDLLFESAQALYCWNSL